MEKFKKPMIKFIVLMVIAFSTTLIFPVQQLIDASFSDKTETVLSVILYLQVTCLAIVWRFMLLDKQVIVSKICSLMSYLAFTTIAFGSLLGTWLTKYILNSGYHFFSSEHLIIRAVLLFLLSGAPTLIVYLSKDIPNIIKKNIRNSYFPMRLYVAGLLCGITWLYLSATLLASVV
ncbi:membrane hypothetical protein [Vibrio crassostreae]|nr:hypothetical protein OAQ_19340 [Vibrio cyclitrophicus ZF30]OEE12482.1 hypothetical protein OC1_14500 [Vibrio cyclitrophicus ZF207]PMH51197.1 hypothetical protein BCU65_21005 [Vibrio cyclitrophicus]CAK1996759.1 membrane hypothetical protein [Vibrio crassostreae]PMJ27804.1 hypothetical protein BCU25_20470 [Vibrio cyclitrophicus]